eukprot:CAMPEP_0173148890 /NCGR_PEP_ID=MMETSP1105-20130129/9995_1 /TAXON_ID=2985 /ORGANISM="Ochromonas sp., Strain BG-1" /LENGTH=516 /DNA_ID=CAMNT_0014063643 /DNA_START=35 /DNA_END=1585 /DNA_ORIENTATION=-
MTRVLLLALALNYAISLLLPLTQAFHCRLYASYSRQRLPFLHVSHGDEQDLSRDELEQKYQQLRLEREKKQLELLSTELAMRQIQSQLLDASETISNNTIDPKLATYDYGFISRSQGYSLSRMKALQSSSVPPNAVILAVDNFQREFSYLRESLSRLWTRGEDTLGQEKDDNRKKLRQLKLSNENIWQREFRRPAVTSPWLIKMPYFALCWLLDVLFDGKPIARFYFLETVARMPYFSYITMLHTYETLGWWRRSTEAKRVHFAEEFNEFHHLLIWEALGGDQDWFVRFLAKHASVVYFFLLIVMWVLSPSLAYNFSELIEAHAVDTYAEFADANKEVLQSMAAPVIAKEYYEALDLYVFDEFQTNRPKGSRRPIIRNLYDVVCNIRDDEAEHVQTMRQCQDPDAVVRSPNTEAAAFLALAAGVLVTAVLTGTADKSLQSTDESLSQVIENLWRSLGSSSNGGEGGVDANALNNLVQSGGVSEEALREVDEGMMATEASLSTIIADIIAKLSRFLR